jgi:hypothetical protein
MLPLLLPYCCQTPTGAPGAFSVEGMLSIYGQKESRRADSRTTDLLQLRVCESHLLQRFVDPRSHLGDKQAHASKRLLLGSSTAATPSGSVVPRWCQNQLAQTPSRVPMPRIQYIYAGSGRVTDGTRTRALLWSHNPPTPVSRGCPMLQNQLI